MSEACVCVWFRWVLWGGELMGWLDGMVEWTGWMETSGY